VDTSDVMSVFLGGVLGGGGRKRARRAARFISGHKGFLSASTLLAAAGVGWGIYDSLQSGASGAQGASGASGAPSAMGAGMASATPGIATAPSAPGAPNAPGAPELVRLVRLAVSAARADGELAPAERALILERAREVGIEPVVEQELAQLRPLASITAGVTDNQRRQDLYVLAFTIVRADENINGAERIYLAQLANQLRLDPDTAARLEQETAARIDATPEE
jgi:uncharacterized membrane protein YebE (DUF533 family)